MQCIAVFVYLFVDDTGFLALTKEEYTNRLISILQMSEQEKKRLRERARKHVQKKFSQEIFEREFISKISDSLSL